MSIGGGCINNISKVRLMIGVKFGRFNVGRSLGKLSVGRCLKILRSVGRSSGRRR